MPTWGIVVAVVVFIMIAGRAVFAVKPGAVLSTSDEITYARNVLAGVWARYGYQLTVTSGIDGDHMQQSKHYEGLAEDYRTRDVTPSDLSRMIAEARSILGSGYQVLNEVDHLHVEYDPR